MQRASTVVRWTFAFLAVVLTVYLAISNFRLIQEPSEHYANFVLAVMVLSSLLALRQVLAEGQVRRGPRFWTRLCFACLLLVLSIVSSGYVRLHALRLELEQPFLNQTDLVMGALLIVAVLLASWFHWGKLLTVVFALGIAYFFWGDRIPHPVLRHPPYDAAFVMSYVGMNTTEGFFWLARLAADKIYFLIIFSGLLLGVGMLRLVLEMGKLVGRFVRGGAAFPAIIGSAMVGTVMGQAVSNVVMVGRLTIPMMQRYGFRRETAGAIEAVASTSGQIIPPVLGLAGFIIASFLNIPYITVALAAVIPAFLFVASIVTAVLVAAARERLPRLSEPVDVAVFPRLLPTFAVSFGVLLLLLLYFYSPSFAGFFGIIAILLLCPFQGRLRPSLGEIWNAAEDGFVLAAQLSLLLVAIGPLGQVIITTNMSSRVSSVAIHVLPQSVFLLLLGTMLLELLAGMELPTPVAYVLVALTLAHFLQELGVPALSAHFFIFYFAIFSTLSPPVALAVMAAARISGASYLGTAFEALKIVLPGFVIPFAFVYDPALLAFPHVSASVLLPVGVVLLIQWAFTVALYGFFVGPVGPLERVAFLAAGAIGTVYVVRREVVYLEAFAAAALAVLVWTALARARGRAAASIAAESDPPGKG